MKKVILFLLGFIPVFSFAGIIITSDSERIEDVSILHETDSTIIYVQEGVEKSIVIAQVSAILYDDGRYKEMTKLGSGNSQDITDKVGNIVEINLDNKAYDLDNINKLDLDTLAFLTSADKKFLKLLIKQINALERKSSPASQSKILSRKVYISTYLQLRETGLTMFEADRIAAKNASSAIQTGIY